MQSEGRIAEGTEVELKPWETEEQLVSVSQADARFSRGFLIADPSAWFTGLFELWSPLLHSLSVEATEIELFRTFDLPDGVAQAASVEFDGEPGFILLSEETAAVASEAVVPGMSGVGAEIVLEYVMRRLLSTLSLSWKGAEPLVCTYEGEAGIPSVSASAFLGVKANLSGSSIMIWFALGPRMLERLDAIWRKNLLEANADEEHNTLSDRIRTVSVELAELAVPPAMLIDYMRPGTVIDLEVPASTKVLLKTDGELWAEGVLCRYNGSVAVRITNIDPEPRAFPEATTRVCIQVAQTELDEAGLLEHSQLGAVLVCDTPISAHASLVISGENVAGAVIGVIDESFALSVLPK